MPSATFPVRRSNLAGARFTNRDGLRVSALTAGAAAIFNEELFKLVSVDVGG